MVVVVRGCEDCMVRKMDMPTELGIVALFGWWLITYGGHCSTEEKMTPRT